MADVFLSYARADMAKAAQVKAALEGAGLSVFFDVEGLDGGDVFPDVLDREVKAAGAVVSLWSPHALSRPWVKQECSIGLKRKCLIPLAIEPLGDLDVPVAFEGLQQIDFTGFHGRTDSAEWQRLMRSLARTLRRPELVAGTVPAAGGPRGPGD
ncbi:MAG: toll/interleukin-1 receptor domain-containing protein, partial [Hyphomonas sp.]|nr:toll/interleukin-1 receptor domain-containing protein [Hyphomonas sp.]